MQAPWWRENILILDHVTGRGWVVSVTSRPRFTPGTHWIGGWMGLTAGLDTEAWGRILCLCRVSNPGRPVCSQDTILTELSQLLYPRVTLIYCKLLLALYPSTMTWKCIGGVQVGLLHASSTSVLNKASCSGLITPSLLVLNLFLPLWRWGSLWIIF
jgi:hypothetical protein